MKILLLVVALGLAGASPIKDNKVCAPHSRPWQVYLSGGGLSCSGVLIDPWWVVTSFDCTPRSSGAIANLGEHDVTAVEGTEQHIPISRAIQHGPYYRSPLHSLTMLRLASPARLTPYVQPIPLPTRCARPGDDCTVSGWGSTVPNQYEPPKNLKCITVPVVEDQTCEKSLPEYYYWSYHMICAGQNNTDNCMNNRASVMVCDGQLQGVQWFSLGCRNPSDPSVYSKLCLYNRWINQVMETHGPLPPTTAYPTTRGK